MAKFALGIFVIIVGLGSGDALGGVFTYNYTGTVLEAKGLNGTSDPFYVGMPLSGTFSIDTDLTDSNPDSKRGEFYPAVIYLDAVFGSGDYAASFASSGPYRIDAAHDGFTDFIQFGADVTGDSVVGEFGTVTPGSIFLQFQSPAHVALSNDQIAPLPPFAAWAVDGGERGHFFFSGGTDQTLVEFYIDGYTEAPQVPEPSAFLLAAIAIPLLLARRR